METKILELRDRGTYIPLLALKLSWSNLEERILLAKGGWGTVYVADEFPHYVMIRRMDGDATAPSSFDPYTWGDRTFATAHQYIEKNFDKLTGGDVIDVEYILGETTTKKKPQQ